MKEPILIFDKKDNLLAVTRKYKTAFFHETVEKPISLTIEYPMEDERAEYLVGGNQVAFKDLEGRLRLFTIREIDDSDGEAKEKIVECLPGMQELTDVIIEEKRPQNRTAEFVLGIILEKSRWKVGNVADLGTNSTSFYFDNAYDSLDKLTDIWGGEIVDRIEVKGNRIAGRYIDLVERKGKDTGKRFEIGKDIKNIKRTVLYYPKTALYGKGSSLEIEDEEGEHTGGYTRKITFRDVVWSKENGDPIDKPKGREWVGDPEAREIHGIPDENGEMQHRFGMFEDGNEENPENLLMKTWKALQEDQKEPKAQYEMDIITFHGLAGYEHEQTFVGDTGIVRDFYIKPKVLIETRVISMEYDIGNPSNGNLVLGNFLELDERDVEIDWVIDKVKDRADRWDSGGGPIDDGRFPDIKPPTPTNLKADGLFQTVMLTWDYDPKVYISAYEVYASQVNGFAPDPSNLIYRGKTGGYNHKANVNEQWYYRIRAINTHGTPSDYTEQVSANTAQIRNIDLEIGAVNAEKLADLAVTADKLADGSVVEDKVFDGAIGSSKLADLAVTSAKIDHAAINEAHISDLAVGNAAIKNAAITNAKIAKAAIDTANIIDAAITNAKIADLAVDDAKIANLSVNKLTAGTLDANKIKIYGGDSKEYTMIDGNFFESRGSYTRTWFGETSTHDIKIRIDKGYLRFRNDSEDKSIYVSDYGISTIINGGGEEDTYLGSGTIEFFSKRWQFDGLGEGVRGITMLSNRGNVALEAWTRDVVLAANRSIHLMANQDINIGTERAINVWAYENKKFGSLPFQFYVKGYSDQYSDRHDGMLFYGRYADRDKGTIVRAGIRFRRDEESISITDSSGDWKSGFLYAQQFNSNALLVNGTASIDVLWYNSGGKASSLSLKSNIEQIDDVGLDIINKQNVVSFLYNEDVKNGNYHKKQLGFISELSPEISTRNGTAIDNDKLLAYNVKATQELSSKTDKLEKEINDIYFVIETLIDENEKLKKVVTNK